MASGNAAATITLVAAGHGDLNALVALRIEAMRESLEQIGRFDPVLALVFGEADALALPVRVGALRDSASNRCDDRHGFRLVERGEFDNDDVRPSPAA